MVVSVTLRQLSFLLGRDFLSLPETERLQSLADVFRFMGKVTGVKIRDDVVVETLLTTCHALEAEIERTRTHAAHLLQAVLKEAFTPAA